MQYTYDCTSLAENPQTTFWFNYTNGKKMVLMPFLTVLLLLLVMSPRTIRLTMDKLYIKT